MNIRVLHVFRALNVGGAETMILNLYREIDREKIQFDFLVHTDEIGYYEEEVLSLGGRIFRLPTPGLKQIYSYTEQLVHLFTEQGFCAVHSHTHSFSGFVLNAAKKANIPVRVAHSHTTSDGKEETLFRKTYLSYMKWMLRKNATHMVACSKMAGESLFGKDAPVIVLPNSFSLERYEQVSEKVVPAKSPVIGHIGRFDQVKNHPFFLEVFYHFKKEHPEATAILVGDGPERDQINKLITEYKLQDSVDLLGIRSDIPEVLSKMDLFLFPSLYEGLGNVVIEAQAAGIPCLVSDAVPREVDLSLNLVSFMDLKTGANVWAEHLGSLLCSHKKPSWDERINKLNEHGYNISENAKNLERIYSGY